MGAGARDGGRNSRFGLAVWVSRQGARALLSGSLNRGIVAAAATGVVAFGGARSMHLEDPRMDAFSVPAFAELDVSLGPHGRKVLFFLMHWRHGAWAALYFVLCPAVTGFSFSRDGHFDANLSA